MQSAFADCLVSLYSLNAILAVGYCANRRRRPPGTRVSNSDSNAKEESIVLTSPGITSLNKYVTHHSYVRLVDVRGFDDESELPNICAEFFGYLLLQIRKFHQIRVAFRPKIDAVRVHDEIEALALYEEIQQADAGYVRRVSERLKRGDRGAARRAVPLQSVDDPFDLIDATAIVVIESSGVAFRVTEFGDASEIGEIYVHPLQTGWIGELANQRITTLQIADVQRCHDDFTNLRAVVFSGVALAKYFLGDP